jgi:hypothetical protein
MNSHRILVSILLLEYLEWDKTVFGDKYDVHRFRVKCRFFVYFPHCVSSQIFAGTKLDVKGRRQKKIEKKKDFFFEIQRVLNNFGLLLQYFDAKAQDFFVRFFKDFFLINNILILFYCMLF